MAKLCYKKGGTVYKYDLKDSVNTSPKLAVKVGEAKKYLGLKQGTRGGELQIKYGGLPYYAQSVDLFGLTPLYDDVWFGPSYVEVVTPRNDSPYYSGRAIYAAFKYSSGNLAALYGYAYGFYDEPDATWTSNGGGWTVSTNLKSDYSLDSGIDPKSVNAIRLIDFSSGLASYDVYDAPISDWKAQNQPDYSIGCGEKNYDSLLRLERSASYGGGRNGGEAVYFIVARRSDTRSILAADKGAILFGGWVTNGDTDGPCSTEAETEFFILFDNGSSPCPFTMDEFTEAFYSLYPDRPRVRTSFYS